MNERAPKTIGQPPVSADAPEWGGIRAGPTLAGVLYVLLVLSAALALWAAQGPLALPAFVGSLAPWVFLGFVVAFAAYRLMLVRARRYPAAKAFFQIGAALLFFMLLFPRGQPQADSPDELSSLLRDPNARVRRLAAEVAGFRPNGTQVAHQLVLSLEDGDGAVREAAHRALVQINGQDLGPPNDAAARTAWRGRYP